jgi:thiol-disulfide isomerase/thioredoxin
MIFIHINKNDSNIHKLNNIISNKKNKVFILFYMEGCGPCNATRPEWKKLENVLSKYKNQKNVFVIDIDSESADKLKGIEQPSAFPSMKFISDGGKNVENFEESKIENKERTVDSFVDWIELHIKPKPVKNTQKGGRKWSLKYKRSINCRRPKGFSQKQYCKYSRKKR